MAIIPGIWKSKIGGDQRYPIKYSDLEAGVSPLATGDIVLGVTFSNLSYKGRLKRIRDKGTALIWATFEPSTEEGTNPEGNLSQ